LVEPIEVLEDVSLDESNLKKFSRIGTSMGEKIPQTRHHMLQFEHKFCMIWIYIEWVMIVWSWAKVMGISMHTH